MTDTMRELSATDCQSLLQGPNPPQFVDVREPWEVETASVTGALNLPMGQVPTRLTELDKDRPVIVMCHHGRRSAQVGMLLERNGFAEVINLAGGIAAWSEDVDPSVPQY
jgi:rhodanese-related sulfurtransferase